MLFSQVFPWTQITFVLFCTNTTRSLCLAGAGAVPFRVGTVSSNSALRILSQVHNCWSRWWVLQVRATTMLVFHSPGAGIERPLSECLLKSTFLCLTLPAWCWDSWRILGVSVLPSGDVVVELWFTRLGNKHICDSEWCMCACGIIFFSGISLATWILLLKFRNYLPLKN